MNAVQRQTPTRSACFYPGLDDAAVTLNFVWRLCRTPNTCPVSQQAIPFRCHSPGLIIVSRSRHIADLSGSRLRRRAFIWTAPQVLFYMYIWLTTAAQQTEQDRPCEDGRSYISFPSIDTLFGAVSAASRMCAIMQSTNHGVPWHCYEAAPRRLSMLVETRRLVESTRDRRITSAMHRAANDQQTVTKRGDEALDCRDRSSAARSRQGCQCGCERFARQPLQSKNADVPNNVPLLRSSTATEPALEDGRGRPAAVHCTH